MPFKSKAQRRKFAELLVTGKITPETYEEWNRSTGRAKLPERIHPKKRAKPRRKLNRMQDAAVAFLRFLADPAGREHWKAAGFELT